eukprot:TRINITY_DN545_c0_g1_i1.p1 TRINITY_DN545_c0_g1~~TRINITY_DN545_c0_g1_i1.p1  ORF type:complete len:394 (+),score=102.32 TRINITY_DN545_c0_g1_i1:53-1183(+)
MIEALLYCEFDNDAGPVATFQIPEKFMTVECFASIADYIIPQPFLCGKLVSISTPDLFRVVGVPMMIENPKFLRNALRFNLCFVFRYDTPISQYEPIVRKLSIILSALEMESEFLSNELSKKKLPIIMSQIFSDLNSLGECDIEIDNSNKICVRLLPKLNSPPEVFDYQVPVLIEAAIDEQKLESCDLVLRKIFSLINGKNYVKKIARESDVDIELVKKCLQNMMYYKCIVMIDIFQYSNMYTVTSLFKRLATDENLQNICLNFITTPDFPQPSFSKIFSAYSNLKNGEPILDTCKNLYSLNIDERKFFTFGLINGFIRRVNEFAILTDDLEQTDIPKSMLDGRHCLDAICCHMNASRKTILTLLEKSKSTIIFRK